MERALATPRASTCAGAVNEFHVTEKHLWDGKLGADHDMVRAADANARHAWVQNGLRR